MLNIGVLLSFKYLDFFIENINVLLGIVQAKPLNELGIILPLGISFYTFQSMSMLLDVYRNPKEFKPTFSSTMLYVSFFPQLVAGPIVRYHDIIGQIKQRTLTYNNLEKGMQRFVWGLFKKVFFANTFGAIADSIFAWNPTDYGTSVAVLGIVAYTLQIYFDFSGYSDMAIGLGRMFGFKIPENFNFPYTATSIQDFWRRWHISLSTWFRDYLYIPLGGNRISVKRTYINLVIVFFITGFWHGASWNFVVWGLFHGLFLIIERIGLAQTLKRMPRIISWSYTILVVMVGWVFFRLESLSEVGLFFNALFNPNQGDVSWLYFIDNQRLVVLLLGVFFAIPWVKSFVNLTRFTHQNSIVSSSRSIAIIGLLFYAIVLINSGSYSPFIYFRF